MTTQRDSHGDARFDAALRALHREALTQVSTGVRWKLKPTAASARTASPARGWHAGVAFAGVAVAVSALALGLVMWKPADDAAPSAPQLAIAPTDAGDQAAGALEQDPDFYAWLASDDVELVAME